MDVTQLAIWFGAIAGILTSVGIIWKKAVAPIVDGLKAVTRTVKKVDDAMPTLLTIAQEFRKNGGNSLRDQIDKIAEASETAGSIAGTARLVAETNASIVKELTDTNLVEFRKLEEYIHDRFHTTANAVTAARLESRMLTKKVDKMVATVEEIVPYVVRHRATDDDDEGRDNDDTS